MKVHANDSDIDQLQKWFEENKKLPPKINRMLLTRFYYCMDKNMEETKKLIEHHYAIRQSCPKIFISRDPSDEATSLCAKYADYVPLPKLSPENCRVMILRIKNPDPTRMHTDVDVRASIMCDDVSFTMADVVIDNVPMIADGYIQIVDMQHFTLRHLARLSISVLRVYLKYLQQAFPALLKGLHIVNCPSYLSKIVGVIRPFVKTEIYNAAHFHTNGFEKLHKYVPKEILPEEYGGDAGEVAIIKEDCWNNVIAHRFVYHTERKYVIKVKKCSKDVTSP